MEGLLIEVGGTNRPNFCPGRCRQGEFERGIHAFNAVRKALSLGEQQAHRISCEEALTKTLNAELFRLAFVALELALPSWRGQL